MVAPLTKEHGLTAQFTSVFTIEYTGLAATLDGKTIAEVYAAINNAFSHALNSPTYAATSDQNSDEAEAAERSDHGDNDDCDEQPCVDLETSWSWGGRESCGGG